MQNQAGRYCVLPRQNPIARTMPNHLRSLCPFPEDHLQRQAPFRCLE